MNGARGPGFIGGPRDAIIPVKLSEGSALRWIKHRRPGVSSPFKSRRLLVKATPLFVAEALEARRLLSVSFATAVNYAAGNSPESVAMGDFNGDGKPDVAVANEDCNYVSVLLSTTLATPVLSNLSSSSSISYGTTAVAFSGSIAAGALTPPTTETMAVTLNGITQYTAINSYGNFTATFNTSTLPESATPYHVTYSYAGDANFSSGTNTTTTTLTVIPAWLGPSSVATWNLATQTLTVTGNATITGNPATFGDAPMIDAGNRSQVVLDTPAASIGGLALQSGATLDIDNNTLFINYGNGSSPLAAVQSGVANGSILSSTANAGKLGQYTVGYADATEMNTVRSGNVELMYTLTGDSRMTESVNFLDYSILQNNYNQTGRDWAQGDWNNDGTVNFLDYSLMQNNYNQTAGQVAGDAVAAMLSSASAQNVFDTLTNDNWVEEGGVGYLL